MPRNRSKPQNRPPGPAPALRWWQSGDSTSRSGWRAATARVIQSPAWRDFASFQASLIFHCLLMLILALLIVEPDPSRAVRTLTIGPEDMIERPLDVLNPSLESGLTANLDSVADIETVPLESANVSVTPTLSSSDGGQPASRPSDVSESLTPTELLLVSEAPTGGGLQGRSPEERARLARERGGSAASERAVELGLAWLAAHQLQEGHWLLDHSKGNCKGRCADPPASGAAGQLETAIGATGLALLSYLGAGYTHVQGKYRNVVRRGLEFLKSQMKDAVEGGDWQWDTEVGMYAHGIATLAVCEAYAMTGDEDLLPYAQRGIDFITFAQHPRGGWRYLPGQPGDTTVTGWQIMALKSGRLARLFVPYEVLSGAGSYLNTVQDGGGAFYGYQTPKKSAGPTAVGLLSRMYLGWSRQDERLRRGVLYLADHGPSQNDMYFNYYATQVLHHYGGPHWDEWNKNMRRLLVGTQARTGHEAGSWFFEDAHGSIGGRHYTTAICTMILEVYYRYMPLYAELD